MRNFFMAMSLYPEVQQRAHKEIDRVIGTDRLPDYEDYEKLIYIRAILLESLRWIPITPVGVAHRVSMEDNYNGFRIPKDATVLAVRCLIIYNCWPTIPILALYYFRTSGRYQTHCVIH